MRNLSLCLGVVLVVVTGAGRASAQYWPGYYGGFASTPGEGFAIGMSALVRSAGMFNLTTAEAASRYQDAYKKGLENRAVVQQQYQESLRYYQSKREAARKPPPTSEQLYRWAHERAPKRLSAQELDPLSGEIAWPIVLREEDYASFRETAEAYFKKRAADPAAFTYGDFNRFQEAATECQAELKSHIRDYKANDFIQAKKFIESLAYEAGQT